MCVCVSVCVCVCGVCVCFPEEPSPVLTLAVLMFFHLDVLWIKTTAKHKRGLPAKVTFL